ncbi:putative Lecithin:cholesterol/phospholipid:diacylglycerol acyltransferase [Blattamonas nauphoetae]|uniref:Lecithin:cholesterol/phospholipid:diacylglycerol acyltransferase n=1 Tax=Blattamonas nauphoetae TaxID=2049346 RepID=A0ABQ9Y424_9EUKA|nr:putative Lecithin:cholesterol/phospholipid:diacylglycerol acyltransferase [Blattamonas nauphoetae]
MTHITSPVLLIPGCSGSMLYTRHKKTGKIEPVFPRIFTADQAFKDGTWAYTSEDFTTIERNEDVEVFAPSDDYGLFASYNVLMNAPPLRTFAHVFGTMNVYLTQKGYEPGRDLFGFSYDWRKDPLEVLPEMIDRIEEVYQQCGKRRITLVSHSMGSLFTRILFAHNPEMFSSRVENWVAIASAFQGTCLGVQAMLFGYALDMPRFIISNNVYRELQHHTPIATILFPPRFFRLSSKLGIRKSNKPRQSGEVVEREEYDWWSYHSDEKGESWDLDCVASDSPRNRSSLSSLFSYDFSKHLSSEQCAATDAEFSASFVWPDEDKMSEQERAQLAAERLARTEARRVKPAVSLLTPSRGGALLNAMFPPHRKVETTSDELHRLGWETKWVKELGVHRTGENEKKEPTPTSGPDTSFHNHHTPFSSSSFPPSTSFSSMTDLLSELFPSIQRAPTFDEKRTRFERMTSRQVGAEFVVEMEGLSSSFILSAKESDEKAEEEERRRAKERSLEMSPSPAIALSPPSPSKVRVLNIIATGKSTRHNLIIHSHQPPTLPASPSQNKNRNTPKSKSASDTARESVDTTHTLAGIVDREPESVVPNPAFLKDGKVNPSETISSEWECVDGDGMIPTVCALWDCIPHSVKFEVKGQTHAGVLSHPHTLSLLGRVLGVE